jgi:hypothetical protein
MMKNHLKDGTEGRDVHSEIALFNFCPQFLKGK